MTHEISKDLMNKYMSQNDLLTTIGWNSIKGLVTSIILVYAFIQFMEFLGYGVLSLLHLAFILLIANIIYYKYFWSAPYIHGTEPKIPYTWLNKFDNRASPLKWTDFFYSLNIEESSQYTALASSWVSSLLIYGGVIVLAYTGSYCADNSSSPIVVSILRIVALAILASCAYAYGQRYEFRKEFWGTLFSCIIFGFTVSISTYALGMAIGVCGTVFGWPITIAVMILEFAFTALYTYMDLITWSNNTHKRLISEEEYAKKKAAEEAAKMIEETT